MTAAIPSAARAALKLAFTDAEWLARPGSWPAVRPDPRDLRLDVRQFVAVCWARPVPRCRPGAPKVPLFVTADG